MQPPYTTQQKEQKTLDALSLSRASTKTRQCALSKTSFNVFLCSLKVCNQCGERNHH